MARSSLIAYLWLVAGAVIVMRTTLQYVAPATSFVGNTNMQTDMVRQSLRGGRQQMRYKSEEKDDVLQTAQEAFQNLPEYAQGSFAGALATLAIASAPALGGVAISAAAIYVMLDERAKSDAQRALQNAFKGANNDYQPEPQYQNLPGAGSSALNDLPVNAGQGSDGNIIPTVGQDSGAGAWPWAEAGHASGYQIGQNVEVMRSDETWSQGEVCELRADGTIIVSINGTKHMKAIYKSGISKYLRGMQANPTVQQSDEGQWFNQPDHYDSRQNAPNGAHNGMAQQHHDGRSNMHQDGQVGNRRLIVGQMVDVLRSDQSWSRAFVTDVKGDGTVVVQIEGIKAIKTITSNNIDSFLRSSKVTEREIQFEPGKLGMEIDQETGQIIAVLSGGQAEALGVEAGWQMVRINDRPYDLSTFYEYAGGFMSYILTFEATVVPAGPPSAGNNAGEYLVEYNEQSFNQSFTPALDAGRHFPMDARTGSSADVQGPAAIVPSASGALDVPDRGEWPRMDPGVAVSSTAMSIAGGGAGFVVGSVAGGIAGAPAAPFTLGLSVPAGAAVGGTVGAIAGTLEGATVGAAIGNAMSHQLRGATRPARQTTEI